MNTLSSQEVAVLYQDNKKLKSKLNELITIFQQN